MSPTAEPLTEKQKKLLRHLEGVAAALENFEDWQRVFEGKYETTNLTDDFRVRLSILSLGPPEMDLEQSYGPLILPARGDWDRCCKAAVEKVRSEQGYGAAEALRKGLEELTLALEKYARYVGADSDIMVPIYGTCDGYPPAAETVRSGSKATSISSANGTDYNPDQHSFLDPSASLGTQSIEPEFAITEQSGSNV